MIKPDEEINTFDTDTPFVYIYVRTDIPPVQQLIQAAHAAHEAGIKFGKLKDENGEDQISHFCIFGEPDERGLTEIKSWALGEAIRIVQFVEPDFDMGLSAIATEPLKGQRRLDVPASQLLRINKRHVW